MPTGLMRFTLPPGVRPAQRAVERAYMAGPDLVPWSCRARVVDDEFQLERGVADSGKLYMPWPVTGYGEIILCTGTLMERPRPYQLLVELARGKINQVRNQLAEWQSIGLIVSAKVDAALHQALEHLALAVTSQHNVKLAAEHAQRAIVAGVDAGETLVACYTEQALAVRHRQMPKLGTLLGANMGQQVLDGAGAAHYLKAFNAALAPMLWRDVEAAEGFYQWDITDQQMEWCAAQCLRICGGPLLQLDARGLPDWLCLWQGDFQSLLAFVSDYVETAVSRYKGKVHMWQCAARINVGEALALREEEKLRLAVRAIEITRDIDPGTPLVVRFDQPWAEYMNRTDPDLSPLHFADALVRSGLQLSALALEINLGFYPGGTSLRDRVDFSRLLDLWSCLGLPLHLMLSLPSGDEAEAEGRPRPLPLAGAMQGGWTDETQAGWVKHYLPMLIAKPSVQAVFWNQLSDAEPCEFPHGGLIDAAGSVKPAMVALANLRKKHLD